METEAPSAACASSSQKKRKLDQVVPAQEIKIEASDQALSMINRETTADCKDEPHVGFNTDQQHRLKDALPNDLFDSSACHSLGNDALVDTIKGSEPKSTDSECFDEIDDCAYDDDGYEEYENEDEDEDEEYEFNSGLVDILSSKFDDMDIPPGVEAGVPWLMPSATKSPEKPKSVEEDEVDKQFKAFKKFDTVQDASDFNFAPKGSKSMCMPASKEWAKRIQHEWKILENDLPENIFVRAYEDRMDLLRAVIVGPVKTPYHDGLFFFDAQFPSNYPLAPPVVQYHSGGLRLNPNLYDNGYVCLSLLGTWHGNGCEKWNPSKSTMLQVLVSIQALVLNEKPYFNEPGYETSSNTKLGEQRSLAYNESTFVLSVRTMLYTLRRSPKHFDVFVAGHFRARGRAILAACKAYMEGVQVGEDVKDVDDDDDDDDDACDGVEGAKSSLSRATSLKSSLEKLFDDLLMEFSVKGADCGKFFAHKVKAGRAAAAAAKAAGAAQC